MWIKFERILNQCCQSINTFSHISLSTNDVNIFHTCIIVFHKCFSSLITVWMMCSSTPLEKEISTLAVLIVQTLLAEVVDEVDVYETLFSECNVTGTIVSFCCGI